MNPKNDLQIKAEQAVSLLEKAYPDAICSLQYEKPYELMMATRLAAQCTDARVNIVTKELFTQFPTLESIADADISELERIVHPCGLYRTKARDLKNMAVMLRDKFHSVVPDTMEELLKLPGIGRKTANLVLGDVYGKPSYVCDTHCIRITNLLGLTTGKDPNKVEMQLREILPPEDSGAFCHRLVLHGRAVCVANRPQCEECILNVCCSHYQNQKI